VTSEIVDTILDANGIADPDETKADLIDIIETYNPWCEPGANAAAAKLAADLGKVTASGSDSHGIEELGRSWMEIEDYMDPADFLEKLRHARHVVTASSGTGRRA